MTATASISVLIVEDSPLTRHGIRAAFASEPAGRQLKIVGEAGTARAALAEAQRLRPDVVLLDLRLPDDNGVNVCRNIRELLPKCCVLILTSSTDNESIYDAIVAGAHGYLLKDIDPPSLTQAIMDGHAGRPVFTGPVASTVLHIIRDKHARAAQPSVLDQLSSQEQRVLAAIAAGHANKDIARLMKLSENTVKNYIANIFQKLGLERRAQAVALYLRHRPVKADYLADR